RLQDIPHLRTARDDARAAGAENGSTAREDHPDLRAERLVVAGLRQIVVGPELQRLDCAVDAAIAGQHENRDRVAATPDLLEDGQPVAPRHLEVEEHQLVGGLSEACEALVTTRCGVDFVAIVGEERSGPDTERPVVVNDEDPGWIKYFS